MLNLNILRAASGYGMYNNDSINSVFEVAGTIFYYFSIIKILKDKCVRGISMMICVFFWVWAVWNCLYLYSLHQRFSFCWSITYAIANSAWLVLAFYYYFVDKSKKQVNLQKINKSMTQNQQTKKMMIAGWNETMIKNLMLLPLINF